jgi:hypothetical protein
MAEVEAAAARIRAQARARRARLTIPRDAAVLGNHAAAYRNPEVGRLTIRQQDGQTWLHAGFVDAPVATRRNADGSVSLATVGPGAIPLELLVGTGPNGRTLTARDSQHEYVYTEVR